VPLAGAVPSWQVVFLVIGLPGLLVSLLLLTVPEPVRRRSPAARGAAEPNAGRGAALAWVRAHWRAYTALAVGFGLFNVYNQGVGFFVPALFMRTHGWTAARIGVTQGLLTAVLGTLGLLAAGRVADRLGRGGRTDGRVRTLLGCSLALLATGATLPLMPTAGGAVALLAASLLVAVAPYGVAAAALTEITPGPVRGRVAAMYLLVINLVGGGLGPVAVGAVSRYVLRDPALLRYAMSAVGAAALAGSAALYAWGLPHVRATRAAAEA
jgi:MFS family permease